MINGLSGVGGAIGTAPNQIFSRGIAAGVTGEMGARAAAWVTQLAGFGAKDGVGFQPDAALLARGGDVYGIADVTREVAGRVGATAAEEGAIQRAIEDFTREAVIAVANHSDVPDGGAALIADAVRAAGLSDGAVQSADQLITGLGEATSRLRG